MTTPSSSTTPRFPGRRSRLAIARDLLVVGLSALLVLGFVAGVGFGGRASNPAPRAATAAS